jgi:hypothetical protein
VGEDSHVVFSQNSLVTKEIARRCVVEMQQAVLLSPKLLAKYSHIFTQSPQNVTVVCGIDCLACQDKFFVGNSLDVKENNEHALDFARIPVSPLSVVVKFGLFH